MSKYKNLLTILGFLLVVTGFLSMIVSVVGLKFSFLLFLESWGSLVGFVLKLLIIMIGFILTYLGQTNFSGK
ncbi:MAG: hypothetical protein LW711_08005 [Saprospiraceae bacterium]|jgi:hypothetical protein|nr:hypothetical protein [Saprospiraceae bacterium]MCF8300599.1 hypothetical protein [Haliscomenobacter sp.]